MIKNNNFTFTILILTVISSNVLAQDDTLKESMARGAEIYINECATCHMEDGQGIVGVFPPLAKSDYLMADTGRTIKALLEGMSGEIVVNGETYYGEMNPFEFTDQEAADIMNYIRNTWENEGETITKEDIGSNRK